MKFNICPDCGAHLDFGEVCDCKEGPEASRSAAGRGGEQDGARAYAEHKLERIIEREGDADGARREPWYLAQLIAETIKGNRFSKFTQDLWETYRYIEQMGIKKGQPTP